MQQIDYHTEDHPGPVNWSAEAKAKIDEIIARYPDKQSAIMPILWLAVEEFGWISPQVEKIVGEVLDKPMNHVHRVLTFYTMYPRKPIGKHHVQICRNISCWLAGAPGLVDHLKSKLGIEPGGVSADGKFSLEEVECLAYCECAPALRIDGRYEGNLTREKIDQLIQDAS